MPGGAWGGRARAAADGRPDRFMLECAYQAMKMDVQTALGFAVEIRVRSAGGRKHRWGLKGKPGDPADVDAATKGRGARQVYRLTRGFVPS